MEERKIENNDIWLADIRRLAFDAVWSKNWSIHQFDLALRESKRLANWILTGTDPGPEVAADTDPQQVAAPLAVAKPGHE
jgi:hypothetical protein